MLASSPSQRQEVADTLDSIMGRDVGAWICHLVYVGEGINCFQLWFEFTNSYIYEL